MPSTTPEHPQVLSLLGDGAKLWAVASNTFLDEVLKMSVYGSIFKEFSLELCKEVQKRPCLYDRKSDGYKDRNSQESAWQEVGDILGITYDLARKRWHNLRSSYTRSKSSKNQFYLAPYMKFLDTHLTNIGRASLGVSSEPELHEIEGEEDVSDSDCSIPIRSPPDSPRPQSPPSPPGSSTFPAVVNQDLRPKKKRTHGSFENDGWQEAARAFFLSQCVTGSAAATPSTAASTSSSIEQSNPDLEYLKGLLPQIEQLDKKNKRLYFQKISNLLFTMLDEQDEVNEGREAKPVVS